MWQHFQERLVLGDLGYFRNGYLGLARPTVNHDAVPCFWQSQSKFLLKNSQPSCLKIWVLTLGSNLRKSPTTLNLVSHISWSHCVSLCFLSSCPSACHKLSQTSLQFPNTIFLPRTRVLGLFYFFLPLVPWRQQMIHPWLCSVRPTSSLGIGSWPWSCTAPPWEMTAKDQMWEICPWTCSWPLTFHQALRAVLPPEQLQ